VTIRAVKIGFGGNKWRLKKEKYKPKD